MSDKDPSFRRAKGYISLAETTQKIAQKTLGKKGAVYAKLFAEWHKVVGPQHAKLSEPQRIVENRHKQLHILHVKVDSTVALRLEYQKQLLLEKITLLLGYPAIQNIVFHQVVHTPITKKSTKSHLQQEGNSSLSDSCANEINDPELKRALQSLGRAINEIS